MYRKISKYAQDCAKELHDLICALAVIPAPSGKEEKRAAFCLDWFHKNGMTQAFIDEVGNVILEIKREAQNDLTPDTDANDTPCAYDVFMAHMDVVFPDETLLPLVEENGIIHCPGIMDNTVNLANLMMCARYLSQEPFVLSQAFLFVCSVGEEGLGNLRGVREICKNYGTKIKRFYAYDLTYDQYTALAVGSLRYEVKLTTSGGHSFLNFGSPNANHLLSQFVCGFYELPIPKEGHTTYNVGIQQGGTSVNTIAQESTLLLEMRSDCYESLQKLHQDFEDYVAAFYTDLPATAKLEIRCIGDRPCEKNVDKKIRQAMFQQVEDAVEQVTGQKPTPISCSTDCNIPLSMGIPSVCVGTCIGTGAHTREEWAEMASFAKGLEIGIRIVCGS